MAFVLSNSCCKASLKVTPLPSRTDKTPTNKLQVVLVNGGTASTSELLAGALHDSAGVSLIGEKTFGKGITQRVVPLSDGSVLLVSTASYMTPNRVPVHKVRVVASTSQWSSLLDAVHDFE